MPWARFVPPRPWGYGELIGGGSSGAGFERARRWYGAEVTDPGLEFGTRPIEEVLAALRADAWLHAVPDRPTPHRESIRRQVREAFLIDSPAWKASVYGRSADVVLRACRALTAP